MIHFPSGDQSGSSLGAWVVIDPVVFQTVDSRARTTRLSRAGSHYLRRAVWQAAHVAARENPAVGRCYEKKRRAEKHRFGAAGADADKLTHIIYTCLRDCRLQLAIAWGFPLGSAQPILDVCFSQGTCTTHISPLMVKPHL